MTLWKRAGIICLAWVSVLCVGDLATDWGLGSLAPVASAVARVGRPLTPVSVAGMRAVRCGAVMRSSRQRPCNWLVVPSTVSKEPYHEAPRF